MPAPHYARAAALLLVLQAALAGTFCTRCQEDFSGFMTRRGNGGGSIIDLQSATARNGEKVC
jgi:hypothetical protein